MLKERTYAALVEAAHAMAKDKGWWDGGIEARSLDDQFNNFHAEISEAWEEYRAGRMEVWYSGESVKPEGFWVEIADLLIRLADTCGAYGVDPDGDAIPDWEDVRVSPFIAYCHESMGRLCSVSLDANHVGSFFADCFNYATETNGIDLWEIIELKMRYNAGRLHRHGGKLA